MITSILAIVTLFWMLVGHAIADYPMQGPYIAAAKRPGGNPDMPWQIALGAHGLIHGLFVGLVSTFMIFVLTGSHVELGSTDLVISSLIFAVIFGTVFAVAETIAHSVIDYMKCTNRINTITDQVLHVSCKIAWVAVLFAWL